LRRDSSPVDMIKSSQLIGFESDEVAVKFADLSLLSVKFYDAGQSKSTLDFSRLHGTWVPPSRVSRETSWDSEIGGRNVWSRSVTDPAVLLFPFPTRKW